METSFSITVLTTLIVCLLSNFVTYMIAKKRLKVDNFSALFDASIQLREQIKSDLEMAKGDIESLRLTVFKYEQKIQVLTERVEQYEKDIQIYKKDLLRSELEVQRLRNQIGILKEELKQHKNTK